MASLSIEIDRIKTKGIIADIGFHGDIYGIQESIVIIKK